MAAPVPIRKTLFKVVPIAFLIGGGMELFMTYVKIGNETFYDTAKRLEAQRRDERRQGEEDLARRVRERQKASVESKVEDRSAQPKS